MATKRAPTVIQVPNGSGVGTQPPVQIPLLDASIISLVNLSSSAITLCNDDTFSTTWPLPAGATQPEPGVDNLWAMNDSGSDVEVLVLTYDARFPGLVPQATSGGGGGVYASLTGPGQVVSPGKLTQLGGFEVDDQGQNIKFVGIAGSVFRITNFSTVEVDTAGVYDISVAQFQVSSTGDVTLSAESGSIILDGEALSFFGVDSVTQGTIIGHLSAVTDANAKAVLASIVNQLDRLNLILNGTT